jgi:simple sugar transport system ATP-binding protein
MSLLGIDKDITKQNVETLSGGEEQTLILARTYFFGSELIILDEPTNNLSVKETRKVLETTRRIHDREGIPIVYVTHNIPRVFPIADRFVVLERGKKVADIEKTPDLDSRDIEDIIVTGKVKSKSG